MDELLLRWGKNVRAARESAGLTQVELAALIEMKQTTVSQWERGEIAPRDEARIRLATVLGTTVAELFPYPETVS